jgi:DNA-binding transcriptional ArsR family regulator
MADPTRSRILMALLDRPAYPAELSTELGLSPQTVSNHLSCLRDYGIVVGEPEGRRAGGAESALRDPIPISRKR